MPGRQRPVIIAGVKFTATMALPFPHLVRATAGLRGALRQEMLAAGIVAAPDCAALTAR